MMLISKTKVILWQEFERSIVPHQHLHKQSLRRRSETWWMFFKKLKMPLYFVRLFSWMTVSHVNFLRHHALGKSESRRTQVFLVQPGRQKEFWLLRSLTTCLVHIVHLQIKAQSSWMLSGTLFWWIDICLNTKSKVKTLIGTENVLKEPQLPVGCYEEVSFGSCGWSCVQVSSSGMLCM